MGAPDSVPVEAPQTRATTADVAAVAIVAPLLAGMAFVGAIADFVARSPRDSGSPALIALLVGIVMAQVAVVAVHRLHDGRDGRLGQIAVRLALGGPLAILSAFGVGAVGAGWEGFAIVALIGVLGMVAGWIAFGVAIAGAGLLRPRAGLALLWSVLALFLFEPWSIRALLGLPFGLAWLLIGLEAWAVRVTRRNETPDSRGSRSAVFAATAAIAGCALVAAATVGLDRVTGRPLGVPGPGPTNRLTVVIDTDSQADDWMAIAYLLARPDVTVRGIAVTGTGPLGCDGGVLQVLRVMALAGKNDIPVACGRRTPVAGGHAFPPDFTSELLGLVRTVPLPDAVARPASISGVDLLRQSIDEASGRITLLALGPLTNVAEAFEADPTLAGRLERLVIMGGAVDVGGNVGGENELAEYNLFVDPTAADIVFRSGARITLVPLDATGDVPVTLGVIGRMRSGPTSLLETYVADLLDAQRDFIATGVFHFWDPLAAVVATDGRLAGFVQRSVAVVTEEGPDSGRTIASDSGSTVTLAVSADTAAFERTFIATLAGAAH